MINILIETKYFISDLKHFLNPSYKFIRSKLNLTLRANTLRIIIFKIPNFFFNFFNKTRIKNFINLNKDFYISKNHEYFTTNINIDEEDILNILNNLGECSNAGAVLRSKGGEDSIIIDKKNSYAKYFDLKSFDKKKQRELFGSSLEKILKFCSILNGCKVFHNDISFKLVKTKGENSNSYWHSDTFCPVIKGFLCLKDITKDDSPFEFSEGSTRVGLLNKIYSDWALYMSKKKSNSPRIIDKNLLPQLEHNKISMIGKKGFMYIANTSGLHKKGSDNSGKERLLLSFEVKRFGLAKKIKRSFYLI